MTTVDVCCDRYGAALPGDDDQAGTRFRLCDPCLEALAGDDTGEGPDRPPAVTQAAAYAEALAALLCHRRRSKRGRRRRRTPKDVGAVRGRPSCLPAPLPAAKGWSQSCPS